MLTIVAYEPELRNQAIFTLLWDASGRLHEITAIRLKHLNLGGALRRGCDTIQH